MSAGDVLIGRLGALSDGEVELRPGQLDGQIKARRQVEPQVAHFELEKSFACLTNETEPFNASLASPEPIIEASDRNLHIEEPGRGGGDQRCDEISGWRGMNRW